MGKEEEVYKILDKMSISYIIYQHPPVYTVEEARKHAVGINGAHCKNLFLRNRKGDRHYLLIAERDRLVKLKELSSQINEKQLSSASPERLLRKMGLTPGSVSPFGLINDKKGDIIILIDRGLVDYGKVNFHPNINSLTITISFTDLLRFIDECGNRYSLIEL